MQQPETTQDDRLWSMLAYVLTFFAPIIAPLVIYLIKKDQSRFVAFHALQSLFFHLGPVVGSIVVSVFAMIPIVGCLAVIPWAALAIAGLVFTIIAAIKSSGGEWYEIPLIGPLARGQVRF